MGGEGCINEGSFFLVGTTDGRDWGGSAAGSTGPGSRYLPPGHVCINRGLHPSERASGRRLTHTDRGEQTQR